MTGANVGGNVPLLTVDGTRVYGDSPVLQSTVSTPGSEYSGYFILQYDDTTAANVPVVRTTRDALGRLAWS